MAKNTIFYYVTEITNNANLQLSPHNQKVLWKIQFKDKDPVNIKLSIITHY